MTFVSGTTSLTPASPVIDYSSRDYVSIFADLVARIPLYLPEWTSNNINDFGIVLLQMFAYVGDIIGYYEDRLAGEAFIQTATQAVSVLNLAAMLDYTPTLSVGAAANLQINLSNTVASPVTVPAGSIFSTVGTSAQAAIPFITTTALVINAPTILFGQVEAVQGTQFTNEQVGTSSGAVNQSFSLQNTPVSANSFIVSVNIGLGYTEWAYAENLIDYGPYSQVYTNFVDANGVFYIQFGDGVNGLVPPLGSPIECSYQTNVGALGNVGANTITQPVSAIVGVVAVTNPAAASGGASSESLASIQANAPASLKTLNRAVTVSDIETLAIQVSGVEWASAIEQTYQLINLYIAPYGGSTVSSALSAAVSNFIDPLTMANTTVTVLSPTYVGINLTATVVAFGNYGNTAVQTEVLTGIANLLALANTGFGFRVALGLVYTTLLTQDGVNYAIVTSLNRQTLCTTVSPLTSSSTYTSISTTPLPQTVNAGDSIILTNPAGTTSQTLVASVTSLAGSSVVFVNSFTASTNYANGSTLQDTTGTNDAVLLDNEIPVVGTVTITVTGGLLGS